MAKFDLWMDGFSDERRPISLMAARRMRGFGSHVARVRSHGNGADHQRVRARILTPMSHWKRLPVSNLNINFEWITGGLEELRSFLKEHTLNLFIPKGIRIQFGYFAHYPSVDVSALLPFRHPSLERVLSPSLLPSLSPSVPGSGSEPTVGEFRPSGQSKAAPPLLARSPRVPTTRDALLLFLIQFRNGNEGHDCSKSILVLLYLAAKY